MELYLVLGISVIGLLFAVYLLRDVLRRDVGTPQMREISDAIKTGAEAFLRRQNRTIATMAIALAALIYILYAFVRTPTVHDPSGPAALAFWTTLSFILGAACSVAAGYMGMWISIRSNIRTASEATKGMNGALQTALRGGAVSGFFVVAMSLLGVAGLFGIVDAMGITKDVSKIPLLIVGYGFGASFVALFAQLGGGIYTKAADVGADLVGKIEAGIPEDDPRNPAVIADLVGDNVGDCAGRGADLFESTAAENIGAMILAAGLYMSNTAYFESIGMSMVGVLLFPLVARAFGIIASAIGILVVRTTDQEDPMKALNRGYYVAATLAMIGFFFASHWLLGTEHYFNFFLCGVIGVLTSVAFVYITQYYTDYQHRPAIFIAEASQTGPATTIIAGLAVGMESTGLPVLVIGAAIVSTYLLGQSSGLEHAGLFGTAVGTMGMLGTAAYILAMDTFGPITDNAGGIIEMSRQPEEVRKRTDRLDAVGNTTKALTKGYAVGSAGLAAFLLFSAFFDEVRNYGFDLRSIDLSKPAVFVGAMFGAMLVMVFSSLAIRAVGRAAYAVINNVREQFRLNPGIMLGTSKPDYGQCVDIVTKSALREMVLPGLLVVFMTLAVGIGFRWLYVLTGSPVDGATGAEVVGGYLMVATITGILMALFMNNGGGAWDNAKKLIETGMFGGKRSEAHRAAVVGDTVGDPFKDTAGPSLHVLIKLLSTITLVLAPLFI
ncbi:MAG: sodium-translocating pyrophosphatase [Ignavibacteriales bacterium]|nr:sodium-translocating pyrophosphatase [Ignavibacteriales bacterium]